MTPFGIASQVLQIVPASDKARVPEDLGAREADQDFLYQLKRAMERRDEAAQSAAARAEDRQAAKSDDASPRGETVSATARDEGRRHSDSVESDDGAAPNRDAEPLDEGQSAADASASEETATPTTDAAAAEPIPDEENAEPASAATAANDADPETGEATIEKVPGAAGIEADPAQTLASADPAEETTGAAEIDEDEAHAVAEEADDVPLATAPLGDAGEVLPTTPASTTDETSGTTSVAAATVLPTDSQTNTLDPTLGAALNGTDQVLAAAAPTASGEGEDAAAGTANAAPEADLRLASAAAGSNPDAAAANGTSAPKVTGAKTSGRPEVVLTPKSGGDIKRPLESGAVRVSPSIESDSATQSSSKGFTPTVTPGSQTNHTPQTGLANALAAVAANQGEDSNSALKLSSLPDSSVATQAGKSGAQGSGAGSANAAPPPQAVAAGLASPQGLTNAANQANPLRAPAPPPPPSNPAAFQVAVHVARALNDGLDQIKIRLHPADLGRVEVKLEFAQDGRVSAMVIADKAETLDLLQRDRAALERALQDAGLQTDSQSLNFGLQGDQAQAEDGKSHGRGGSADADDLEDDLAVSSAIPPTRPLSAQAGTLNILV